MILLSLFFLIASVLGANNSVGIKAGDWVKYSVTFTGNPFGSVPYSFTWIKIEFVSVTETSATYRETSDMQNGTETNRTRTLDLASNNTFPLIPANSVITDETTRSYAGASRTVLVTHFGGNVTYYFDKQTGINLEEYLVGPDFSLSVVATETNLWSGGLLGLDWWAWATIIVVVAVVFAAAALVLRRRKHTAPTPTKEVLPQTPVSSVRAVT